MATQANCVERRTYSVREAARIIGYGRNTTYDLIKAGEIRALRVSSRKIVVPRMEIERLLAGKPAEA